MLGIWVKKMEESFPLDKLHRDSLRNSKLKVGDIVQVPNGELGRIVNINGNKNKHISSQGRGVMVLEQSSRVRYCPRQRGSR